MGLHVAEPEVSPSPRVCPNILFTSTRLSSLPWGILEKSREAEKAEVNLLNSGAGLLGLDAGSGL